MSKSVGSRGGCVGAGEGALARCLVAEVPGRGRERGTEVELRGPTRGCPLLVLPRYPGGNTGRSSGSSRCGRIACSQRAPAPRAYMVGAGVYKYNERRNARQRANIFHEQTVPIVADSRRVRAFVLSRIDVHTRRRGGSLAASEERMGQVAGNGSIPSTPRAHTSRPLFVSTRGHNGGKRVEGNRASVSAISLTV